MNTDDNPGPRSTDEAYAAHRGDVARRLLADPSSLPQPWNEKRLGGWPVVDAVFVYMPEVFRGQASLQLGLRNEGVPFPEILERQAQSGWVYLRQRLSTGELSATGIRDGSTDPLPIPSSAFDSAELDYSTGSVLIGSARILGVRVFDQQAIPRSGTALLPLSPAQKGGADAKYNWEEFRRELLRAAFAGEVSDRREIRRHMKDWCAKVWEEQPDESRMRQILTPLFHDDIPEKAAGQK